MKQSWTNKINIDGVVIDHTLENKISKKGVPYISGDLNVTIDENNSTVIKVHFTYVTEFYKSGKENKTYKILQDIINLETYEVSIQGEVETNDFVSKETGEVVSPKRIAGKFVSKKSWNPKPATFRFDTVIVGAAEKEYDDGERVEVELTCYTFDYFKNLIPFKVSATSKAAMNYFLGQNPSKTAPLVTAIWGEIKSSTVSKETVIESAFGEPQVIETDRAFQIWDVTGAYAEPMEFGDEAVITKKELKECMDARVEHLKDVKRNYEEYVAAKNAVSSVVDDDEFPF